MNLLVVDLEATCWRDSPTGPDSEESEIIEIGYAMIRKDRTVEIGTRLVRPRFSTVSEFCTELTTLTQDQVTLFGMPSPQQAMDSILTELGVTHAHKLAFASWGAYDRKMLERQSIYLGAHLNIAPMYGLLAGKSKAGGLKSAVDNTVGWNGTHHRGDADAMNAARLLIWMMQRFDLGRQVREMVK